MPLHHVEVLTPTEAEQSSLSRQRTATMTEAPNKVRIAWHVQCHNAICVTCFKMFLEPRMRTPSFQVAKKEGSTFPCRIFQLSFQKFIVARAKRRSVVVPHSHQAIVCLFEYDFKSVNQDVHMPINIEASPHLSPLACLVFSAGCGQLCQEFPLQTQLQSIFRCILKSWIMARAVCAPSAYLGACSCARRPNCTID